MRLKHLIEDIEELSKQGYDTENLAKALNCYESVVEQVLDIINKIEIYHESRD
jgi:hypothetical protein